MMARKSLRPGASMPGWIVSAVAGLLAATAIAAPAMADDGYRHN